MREILKINLRDPSTTLGMTDGYLAACCGVIHVQLADAELLLHQVYPSTKKTTGLPVGLHLTTKFEEVTIRAVMVNQTEAGKIFPSAEQLPINIQKALGVFFEAEPYQWRQQIESQVRQLPLAYWKTVPQVENNWLQLVVLGADTAVPTSLLGKRMDIGKWNWYITCSLKQQEESLHILYTEETLLPRKKKYSDDVFQNQIFVQKYSELHGWTSETPILLFIPGNPIGRFYQVDQAVLIVAPQYLRQDILTQVHARTELPLQAALVVTSAHQNPFPARSHY